MPESLHSEAPSPAPIRAYGCRRINLEMRVHINQAEHFSGLPRGTAKPLTFLFAFQHAEPYLGLPTHAFKLVSYLVGLTKPQDWEEGSRPIAAPSTKRLAEFLGLRPRAVQNLNRLLQEAGIFVMRDHPTGRRFCRRDAKGRIIEAYGFDLSLLALRYDEFVRIAGDAKVERNRMRDLHRRKTTARKAIVQIAEELDVQGHDTEQLRLLMQEAAELVKVGSRCEHSEELALAVKALESRKAAVEQMLDELIKPVENTPEGAADCTLNTSTSLTANDINHTVIASEACSRAEARPLKPSAPSQEGKLFPEQLNVTPTTMVELAPRLAAYMPPNYNDWNWRALIEAALYLSSDMDINRTLWARACNVMGREYAAVALALVSTRPAGHFTSGPGGYFAGMLRKFERGELCLSRTLWKLKDEMWGKERRRSERRV